MRGGDDVVEQQVDVIHDGNDERRRQVEAREDGGEYIARI